MRLVEESQSAGVNTINMLEQQVKFKINLPFRTSLSYSLIIGNTKTPLHICQQSHNDIS